MPLPVTPCDPAWTTTDEVRLCCDVPPPSGADGVSVFSDARLLSLIEVATDFLYNRSARQFTGPCTSSIRPTNANYEGCSGSSEVNVGLYPIISIDEVLLDGAIVDPSLYTVYDARYLVSMEDSAGNAIAWPQHQNLSRETTEENTFEITATHGFPVPPLAREAAIELTCQLVSACVTGECKIPVRATAASRGGLQIVMPDFAAIKGVKTGLPRVDMFLSTYNPNGLIRSPRLLSSDLPRNRRRNL